MKKGLSILLTLLTMLTALYGCTFCAFAETTTKYWEPKHGFQDSAGYVNGELSREISSMAVPNTNYCEITYSKEGKVIRWEFPTLTENKDYTVISQGDNSITVLWTNEDQGAPYINAIVDFENETTKQETTTKKSASKRTAAETEETPRNKAVTKESTTAKTTSKAISNANANINSETDNLNADNPVIIGGIIAIILSSAIITMFVKKKITRR